MKEEMTHFASSTRERSKSLLQPFNTCSIYPPSISQQSWKRKAK